MKNIIFISILFICSTIASAQPIRNVVHLKNGDIITGLVIEYDTTATHRIKIKTDNGSLMIYPSAEVLEIRTESSPASDGKNRNDVNPDEYGGRFSYGPTIGGGGLVGFPVQFRPSRLTALELGLYFRPIILVNRSDDISFKGGAALAGGLFLYFSKHYNSYKRKVKLNGISLKTGHSFGTFSQTFGAVAWASERFQKRSPFKSFIFELGLGATSSHFKTLEYVDPGTQPLIYWKINWAFYSK